MEGRSPFFVVQNFFEQQKCEHIVDTLNFLYSDVDVDGAPVKTFKGNEDLDELLYNELLLNISKFEKHYNVTYRSTEPGIYEWYPQACKGETPHCENSIYNNKWVKAHDRDFTGVVFLSEYQDKIPFDGDFEVFGGCLDLSYWGFNFRPQMGTLVLFPSCPNFVNATSTVHAGDLYQIRFHIATKTPFKFDKDEFPGEWKQWFEEYA